MIKALTSIEPRKKRGLLSIIIRLISLIGILIMVYSNPHLTGEYNPLYTLTNHRFFIAQFTMELPL